MIINANYNGSNYELDDRLGNIEDTLVSIISLQATTNSGLLNAEEDIDGIEVQALGGDPLDQQALERITTLEDAAAEWIEVTGFTKTTETYYVTYEGDGVSGNAAFMFSIVLKRTVDSTIEEYYSAVIEKNTSSSPPTRILLNDTSGHLVYANLFGGASNMYVTIWDHDGENYITDEVELVSMKVWKPLP